MAQDSFEKILKRQLESRRLAPSDNAWERINARPRTGRSRRGWYFGAAAAACLLLLVGRFFFSGDDIRQPATVVTAPEKVEEKQGLVAPDNLRPVNPLAPRESNAVVMAPATTTASTPQPVPETVAETPIVPVPVTVEERKIQEIVAVLDERQENGQSITDATVDSLLAKAQREIALEKQQRNATDPSRLLAESESELDRNFKDRVFAAINKFKKVRIAGHSNNNP